MQKSDRKKVPRDLCFSELQPWLDDNKHHIWVTGLLFSKQMQGTNTAKIKYQHNLPQSITEDSAALLSPANFPSSDGAQNYKSQRALGMGLRKPRSHNNKQLTLVWFPQYQEQGLGTHSSQLWQGRKFLLQELSGTVPPHDRDWRHENLLLVSFKKIEKKRQITTKQRNVTVEFKLHLQTSLKFHSPAQIYCMTLGSFCTILNSMFPWYLWNETYNDH